MILFFVWSSPCLTNRVNVPLLLFTLVTSHLTLSSVPSGNEPSVVCDPELLYRVPLPKVFSVNGSVILPVAAAIVVLSAAVNEPVTTLATSSEFPPCPKYDLAA